MLIRGVRSAALACAAVMLLSACGPNPLLLPGSKPAQEATETMQALATEVQATLSAASPPSPAPADSASPAIPADSATPAPTDTAAATSTPADTATPVNTATSTVPTAHVNQNTNCRSGPGTVYDLRYTALIGVDLTIVGRTTLNDYVIVNDPNHPGQTCWLWLQYVDVSGDLSTLPLSTPPPTPTPSIGFKASYSYMEGCVGWDPGFKIENTGSLTLKSVSVSVKDNDTSTTESFSADNFDKLAGCPVANSIPKLDPGDTGYAYAHSFAYNPSGHSMHATIKVCSETGLGGTCATRSFDFTP
jgi:uncharacterized protein YraI